MFCFRNIFENEYVYAIKLRKAKYSVGGQQKFAMPKAPNRGPIMCVNKVMLQNQI